MRMTSTALRPARGARIGTAALCALLLAACGDSQAPQTNGSEGAAPAAPVEVEIPAVLSVADVAGRIYPGVSGEIAVLGRLQQAGDGYTLVAMDAGATIGLDSAALKWEEPACVGTPVHVYASDVASGSVVRGIRLILPAPGAEGAMPPFTVCARLQPAAPQ